jgi:predicted metalloprotease with PDZ domain
MAPALPVTSSETLPAATTLGMAYDDSCVVSRVLIGGPAFLSGKIAEGDTLLAINGVSLTGIYGSLDEDAIVKLLVGDDIPGSECQVCFEKAVTGFNETVCLKRMPNDLLAHKRQMMSALESLRLRLKVKYNDSHSIKSLDIIMDLWRATIVSQHEHDQACRSLAAEIQQQTSGLLARLRSHLAEAAKGSGTAAAVDSCADSTKYQELMDMIEITVKKERIVPHLPVVAPDVVLPTATTLGLGYDDSCVVSRLLVGGPASLSGKIVEGDMLLAINRVPLRNNGMKLDDNAIVRLLVGSDVPGSECQVRVRACACFRVLFVCVCVCECEVCASPPCMLACVRSCVCESLSIQTCRWTSGALKAGQTRP